MFTLIDKDTGIALTPDIDPQMFPEAFEAGRIIESPEWVIFGDTWTGTEWLKTGERPEPPTQKQLRKSAYETMRYMEDGTPLIDWQGEHMTVDECITLGIHYEFRKENVVATTLSGFAIAATQYIRELYND